MNNLSTNTTNAPITAYSFSPSVAITLLGKRVANKVLANFFSSVQALASKPVFSMSGNKVVINIFYYISSPSPSRGTGVDKALSSSAINSVGEVLSKLFKRPVELHLVRLHYPYLNSYILAQYISINTAKYNFTRIISRLWGANAIFRPIAINDTDQENTWSTTSTSGSSIPAYITGMKVKISGRLVTQRSVPRQTVQTAQVGSFSTSGGVQEVESASFTSKNKKGAFTVKVWIGQSLLQSSKAKRSEE